MTTTESQTGSSHRRGSNSFLGRHPAPVPQRSASLPLPRIAEDYRKPQSLQSDNLFIGGHQDHTDPNWRTIPRYVPLFIRLQADDEAMPKDCVCKNDSTMRGSDMCYNCRKQGVSRCSRNATHGSSASQGCGRSIRGALHPIVNDKESKFPAWIGNMFRGCRLSSQMSSH